MKEFDEKELLLLAYLEGDLSKEETNKVEAMLAEDAALMNEYRLLSKTILPAKEVVYANKTNLKKPVPVKKVALGYLFWSGAVAACLAVLILLYTPKVNNSFTSEVQKESTIEKAEKELANPKNTESSIIENNEIVQSQSASEEIISIPKAVTTTTKTDIAKQSIEPFKKKNLVASQLNKKPTNIPNVEMPSSEVVFNTKIEQPTLPIINNTNNKSWVARKTDKINNTLSNWASYLQKPKIDISKKEPTVNGRVYWAITLEADEYAWEGRLYTRQQ